jgi:hypothetical protein
VDVVVDVDVDVAKPRSRMMLFVLLVFAEFFGTQLTCDDCEQDAENQAGSPEVAEEQLDVR